MVTRLESLAQTRIFTADILCLWFRASLIYINNCSKRLKTKQSIILLVHSTRLGCQPHPSSGVHKTVTTASGTLQLPPSKEANLAALEGGSCTKNMTSNGGCSYSSAYSWWWVWLTPKTC